MTTSTASVTPLAPADVWSPAPVFRPIAIVSPSIQPSNITLRELQQNNWREHIAYLDTIIHQHRVAMDDAFARRSVYFAKLMD